MLSYTTEAGISPRRATHFLSPESKQRAQPDCPRPCGFASGQTCVTPFGLRCGKTRFALRAPLRQVAANLKTKHWHSAVPMPAARTTCRRRRHTGGSGYGRPARVVAKLASSPITDCGNSYQFDKEAIPYPHPVLPLLPTPATAASCGARLHRRVQTHRALTCGNLFERSAASTQRVLPHSHRRLTPQVAPQRSEGVVGSRGRLFAYFLVVRHTGRRK